LYPLTEKQRQKVQVCGNNWVRRIERLERADKRRTDDKISMRRIESESRSESFKKNLVRSRLKRAGEVERKGDEN